MKWIVLPLLLSVISGLVYPYMDLSGLLLLVIGMPIAVAFLCAYIARTEEIKLLLMFIWGLVSVYSHIATYSEQILFDPKSRIFISLIIIIQTITYLVSFILFKLKFYNNSLKGAAPKAGGPLA